MVKLRMDLMGWMPLLVFVAALAIGVVIETWQYHECRKVGHSIGYCLLERT